MPKIAIVQFKASINKDHNLDRILNFIEKAAKKEARLCAFPEFMMFYTTSSQTPNELASLAEKINGKFVTEIKSAAKKNRVYDSAFLINNSGKILSTYRKIHLYNALGFRESDKMTPGSKITLPSKTSVGRLGMQICYDLRFPEMSRILASAGSEILVVPSAWVKGKMKEEHWLTLNKTRAIENGCYVIAPDQVGNIYCGRSVVVDPFGKILLDMKKRQGIGYVNISLDKVKQTRKALPLLKNRRTDLYRNFRI